jgi:hypothetical protein
MVEYDQPWLIVQEKIDFFHKPYGSIYCDRQQHLFVVNYPANRYGTPSSAGSTSSAADGSITSNGRSTRTNEISTISKCRFRLSFIF